MQCRLKRQRGLAMRTVGIGTIGALLAGALAGCCCCGNGCAHSPVPYSVGNPYECGMGSFWGVGYYMQQYGFLHRPCNDPCDNCDGGYTTVPVIPAQETKLPMPISPVTPYDSNPPAPQVPAAPETDDTAAPDAPEP